MCKIFTETTFMQKNENDNLNNQFFMWESEVKPIQINHIYHIYIHRSIFSQSFVAEFSATIEVSLRQYFDSGPDKRIAPWNWKLFFLVIFFKDTFHFMVHQPKCNSQRKTFKLIKNLIFFKPFKGNMDVTIDKMKRLSTSSINWLSFNKDLCLH